MKKGIKIVSIFCLAVLSTIIITLLVSSAVMCAEKVDCSGIDGDKTYNGVEYYKGKCQYEEVLECLSNRIKRVSGTENSGEGWENIKKQYKEWEEKTKESRKLIIGESVSNPGISLSLKSYSCNPPEKNPLKLKECGIEEITNGEIVKWIEILQGSSCMLAIEVKSENDPLGNATIYVTNDGGQLDIPSFKNDSETLRKKCANFTLEEHEDSGDKKLVFSVKVMPPERPMDDEIPPIYQKKPDPQNGKRRSWGIGLTIGGAVVAVGGFVMLMVSHVNLNGVEEHCLEDVCPKKYEDTWDRNRKVYWSSWGMMGLGVVAVGFGTYLIVNNIEVEKEKIGQSASIKWGQQDSVKIGWQLRIGQDVGMALDVRF